MPRITNPLNANEWIDLSEGVEYLPVRRSLVQRLGLFQPEFLESKTVIIPVTTVNDYEMVDIPWGTRMKNVGTDGKQSLTFLCPHYAVEEAVRPADIQNKVSWDDFLLSTRSETVQSFMDKKQIRARQAVMRTWDKAYIHLIREGTAYAPNGTVVNNYYTAFGVTRSDLTLNLAPTANPRESIQAIVDDIVDNFKGGFVPNSFLGLAGKDLFDALRNHPYVMNTATIYKEDRQSIEVLTSILGTQGIDLGARYEALEFGGVVWIRCATEEMPVDEARVFPTDLPDLFKVFFAPSDLTFDTINKPAQPEYYFEKAESDRTAINFSYESNFLVATLWPKAIVKVTAAYV